MSVQYTPTELKKGYVVTLHNLPINMNGENYVTVIFAGV